MIYTNGKIVISTKSNVELFNFAKRAGLGDTFVGLPQNPHFEIRDHVPAEVLRKQGAMFKFGVEFLEILQSPEYLQRARASFERSKNHVFIPVVKMSGDGKWLGRRCPTCREIGWVGVYRGRESEALAYISKKDWECAGCQKNTEEVQQHQIA